MRNPTSPVGPMKCDLPLVSFCDTLSLVFARSRILKKRSLEEDPLRPTPQESQCKQFFKSSRKVKPGRHPGMEGMDK